MFSELPLLWSYGATEGRNNSQLLFVVYDPQTNAKTKGNVNIHDF